MEEAWNYETTDGGLNFMMIKIKQNTFKCYFYIECKEAELLKIRRLNFRKTLFGFEQIYPISSQCCSYSNALFIKISWSKEGRTQYKKQLLLPNNLSLSNWRSISFCKVFRGHRKRPAAWNGLSFTTTKETIKIKMSIEDKK